jgi:hypothetical protein
MPRTGEAENPMKSLKYLWIAVTLTLAATASDLRAQERQVYGDWKEHPSGGYWFREYRFQPTANAQYERHLCIYYPSRPGHFYYYDPKSGLYWGRYNLKTRKFETLKNGTKRLEDVRDSSYEEQREAPTIPGSTDGERRKEPPTELPGK